MSFRFENATYEQLSFLLKIVETEEFRISPYAVRDWYNWATGQVADMFPDEEQFEWTMNTWQESVDKVGPGTP